MERKQRFRQLTDRRKEISHVTFGAMTVGVLTGFASVFFIQILSFLLAWLKDTGGMDLRHKMLLFPVLAGVLIGAIRQWMLPKDRTGFGVVPVILELLNIETFLMKPKEVIIKFFGTIISLVGGFSVGRFGPVVHLGGAIGSNIAYYLKMNHKHIRLMIGCGVAGSIAGFFNAPLFAALFVIMVLFNRKFMVLFTPILISSITSVVVVRSILGDQSMFQLTGEYGLRNYLELVNYVVMGVLCGSLSSIYMKAIRTSRDLFGAWRVPSFWKPVSAGLVIGAVGWFVPGIFELYYDTIHGMFANQFTLGLLVVIVVAKLVVTAVSLGSGGFGGSFTPGLFIGAGTGSAFGIFISTLLHIPVYNISTYAVVGMGAVFAGFGKVPLTATIMVLELTQNYGLILPILVATTLSSMTAEWMTSETIYTDMLRSLKTSYPDDLSE